MIILSVFPGSALVDVWAQRSASICTGLAIVFLAINLGRNYASWIVETDMSINIKSIATGLVYVVAIMNYKELGGGFVELLRGFTDQFSAANFFDGAHGTGDTQYYMEAMKKMFDDFVPLGVGDVFNGFGRMIRPIIEFIQIISIAILYITGPIALAFSILIDSSVFKKWLNSLIVVMCWTITMNLLETISLGLAFETTAKLHGLSITQNGVASQGLFWFIVQIMYLMVPFLTAKYINISSVGGIGSKLMAVGMGAAAMATRVGGGAASMGSAMGGGGKGAASSVSAAFMTSGGGSSSGGGSAPSRGAAASSTSSINNAITKQK